MSYNFLGLVNDIAGRMNEVQLTSSNFATAANHYIPMKESVNNAIRFINQEEYEWPFNHTTQSDVLTAGTMRYSLPATQKVVDWDSFRIIRDSTLGNETLALSILSYEEYLISFVDDEENSSNTGIRSIPTHIIRTPDQKYIVHPSPDKAYTLKFEYYDLPIDLSLETDVPSIPESFRHVLVDGAMWYVYMFQSDLQKVSISEKKFKEGIKNLRSIYVNRYDYVRTTFIERNYNFSGTLKVN